MSDLLEMVSKQIGAEQVSQIAQKLGATPEQTENAIGLALPTLLGAVAKRAENDAGVEELHQKLQQQDDSTFDQLSGLLGGGDASAASGLQALGGASDLLGGLLGQRQEKVEQGVGKAAGMQSSQISSLMKMLAPMLLSAIGSKSKQQGQSAGDLASMLRGEKAQMQKSASGGLLAGLLDQDGDGDFDLSDVTSLGMKSLFGRK